MKFKKSLPKEFKPRPIYRRMPVWIQRSWDVVEKGADVISKSVRVVARRIPLWAAILLWGLVGMGIGALIMKQKRDAADVAVAVNGEKLIGKQFYHRLELTVGTQALNKLIAERLLEAYARQHGIVVADAEIDRRQHLLASDPTYSSLIRVHQFTLDDLRVEAHQQLLSAKLFGGSEPVTEAEIREFYRRESDPSNPHGRLYQPPRIALRFLASPSETVILQAWKELQKGTKMEEVQKHHAGLAGGTVPQWAPNRTHLADAKSFDARINALKPNETASPMLVQGKWWIVRCDRNDRPETPSLESEREACRAAILLDRVRRQPDARAWEEFAAFRKSANVEVYGPRYRELQNAPPQTVGSAR